MIRKIITAVKDEYKNFLFLSIPFIFLNIFKILIFHGELVYYEQDFSNVIYVLLFTGSWVVILYFLFQNNKIIFIIFWIVQFIYIGLNFSYLHYYGSYLSVRQAVSLFPEFMSLLANGSVPYHPKLLIFIIDLPIVVLIFRKKSFPVHGKTVSSAASVICIFMLLLLYSYRIPELSSNLLRSDKSRFIGSFGLLTMQVYDYAVSGDYEKQLNTEGLPVLSRSLENKELKSIVFIQVETLDANVLQMLHNGKPVMPFLSSLVTRSVYFPYMLSYHEGGGSSDADFTVLNSIEPLDDYAVINLPSYDYENSVVKRFSAAGYSTMAFHGNVGSYWNRDVSYPKMGFERFYDIDEMELKEYGWGARDSDVFSFVSSFINSHDKPYFNHIITMSSHGPFKNVGLYYENSRFDDLPEKSIDRAYFTAMAYVDSCLEDFFINSSMDLSDTIIFIYGDHTEYYSTDSEAHRAFYVDGALKLEFVPLIIVGEGENWKPETNRWAASFLDIGPTALAASGIAYNIQTKGIDLLGVGSSRQIAEIPFNGKFFNRNELFLLAEGTR